MRSYEFLPIRDHIEESIEEMRCYLRDNPSILKETTGYEQITSFLNLHLSNSDKPIIGDSYVPVQITSQSFAASLLVRTSNNLGVLVSVDESNKAYTLDYNGKIERFPKCERKVGDITQFGLLYKEKIDADHFISALSLTFSEWDIKITRI